MSSVPIDQAGDINKVRAAQPAGERTIKQLSDMVLEGMDEGEAIKRIDPVLKDWGFDEAERQEYYRQEREIIEHERNRPGVLTHALHGVQSSAIGRNVRGQEATALPERYRADMPAHLQAVVGITSFLPDMPLFLAGGGPGFGTTEMMHKAADKRNTERWKQARKMRPDLHDAELERWMQSSQGMGALSGWEIAQSVRDEPGDLPDTAEGWKQLAGEVAPIAAAGAKGVALDRVLNVAGGAARKLGEQVLTTGERAAVRTAQKAGEEAAARGASQNTRMWHAGQAEEAQRALSAKLSAMDPALGAFKTSAEIVALPVASAAMEGRFPTGEEIIHNGMLVLGLNGMHMLPRVTRSMRQIFPRTGIAPEELRRQIVENPNLLAEMMAGQHKELLEKGGKHLPRQLMAYAADKRALERLRGDDGSKGITLPGDWEGIGLRKGYGGKPVEVDPAADRTISGETLDVAMAPEHALETWISRDAFTPEQYVQLQQLGLAVDGYVHAGALRGLISYEVRNTGIRPERAARGGRTDRDPLRGEEFQRQLRTSGMAVDADGAEWRIGKERDGNGYWLGRTSSDKVGPQFLGRGMTFEEAADLAWAFQEGGGSVFAWRDRWAARREKSAQMSGAEKMPGSYRETPDGPLLDEQGRRVSDPSTRSAGAPPEREPETIPPSPAGEGERMPEPEPRPEPEGEPTPEDLMTPEEWVRSSMMMGDPNDITDMVNKTMDRLEMAKDLIADLVEAGRDVQEAQALGLIAAAHAEIAGPWFGMDPYDYLYTNRARYVAMRQEEFEALGRTGLQGMYELRQRKAMLDELGVNERASLSAQRRTMDPAFDYFYGRVDADSVAEAYGREFLNELRRELGPNFFARKGDGERIENLAENYLRETQGGRDGFMDVDVDLNDIQRVMDDALMGNKEFFDRMYTGKLYQMIGEQGAGALDRAENATRRLDNLGIARQMETAGKDAKAIKLATGWERGKDGKWRYEIDDSWYEFFPEGDAEANRTYADYKRYKELDAKYFGEGLSAEEEAEYDQLSDRYSGINSAAYQKLYDGKQVRLSDILEAPELFEAYPVLENMSVEVETSPLGVNGSATIVRNSGTAAYKTAKDNVERYPTYEAYRKALEDRAERYREAAAEGNIVASDNLETVQEKIDNSREQYARWQETLRNPDAFVGAKITLNRARFSGEGAESLRGVLIHEIQHVIQAIEGFARGGSPYEFSYKDEAYHALIEQVRGLDEKSGLDVVRKEKWQERKDHKISSQEYNDAIDNFRKNSPFAKEYEDILRRIDEFGEDWDRKYGSATGPMEIYNRLTGEVESRNVQTRMDMSYEERLNSLASETEDVAREHQIVLREGLEGGAAAMASIPENPLVAIHNISADNLVKAAQLGGLPVPSIGITKAATPYSDFGEISLIGTREMIEPTQTPQRAVGLNEFAGAVVPDNISPEAFETLRDNGIHIETYKANDNAERQAKVQALSTMLSMQGANTLFQTAYHGTPHRFDRFTLEHIGEGEGGQAHGWGLYFAQDRAIAEGYRENLTNHKIFLGGKEYTGARPEAVSFAAVYLEEAASLKTRAGRINRAITRIAEDANPNDRYDYRLRQEALEVLKAIKASKEEYSIGGGGSLFAVDIPENDVLLDEDRTYDEQPEKVKKALRKLGIKNGDQFFSWDSNSLATPSLMRFIESDKTLLERVKAGQDAHYTQVKRLGGGNLYFSLLVRKYGTPEAASKALNAAGIKGITYEGGRDGRCFVVFDDKAIETLETYYQRRGETAKGGYRPLEPQAVIGLFGKADASTVIHETGHHWLEELRRAVEEGKAELPRELWSKLQKAYKFDTLDDPDVWENVHERFARDFEAYMREGKAPSWELQGVFAQFRDWLREIYRTVRALLGEEQLSEDVRQVFDRLLATEEELARSPRKTMEAEREGRRKKAGEEPTAEEADFMAGRDVDARGPEEIPVDMRPAVEEGPTSPAPAGHPPQRGGQESEGFPSGEAGSPSGLTDEVGESRVTSSAPSERLPQETSSVLLRSTPSPEGKAEPEVLMRDTGGGQPERQDARQQQEAPTRDADVLYAQGGGSAPAPQGGQGGQPQPLPTDFREENVVRLENIAADFSEVLNVPIRLGRLGRVKKIVQGFFRIKQNVIRVRKMQDVATVAHEYGHAIQKAMFERVDPADLAPWANELAPLASPGDPVLEGFAQFVSLFVTDPNQAQHLCPTFYTAFTGMLNKKRPDVMGALLQARDTLEAWKQQPAAAQVASHISFGEEGQESLVSRLRRREGWEDLYTRVVNKLYGLRWAEKQIAGEAKLAPEESPYLLARLYNGVQGKIDHFLHKGTFSYKDHTINGESLGDIMREVDNQALFATYLVARRGVKLAEDRGIETGIDLTTMREVYDSGKTRYEAIAKRLGDYQDRVLQFLVDGNVIDSDAAKRMRALNENYVPFQRLMVDEAGKEAEASARSGVRGGGDNLSPSNPIRAIRGSNRMIINPLESIVANTAVLIEAAEKNKIARSLVELAGKYEDTGWLVEKIDPKMIRTDLNADVQRRLLDVAQTADPATKDAIEKLVNTGGLDGMFSFFQASKAIDKASEMVVYIDGKPQVYKVDRRIAQVMNNLTPESLPVVVRMLGFFSRALRTGVTLDWDFMVRNLLRDSSNSYVLSRSGFKPFVDTWKGLVSAWKRDEDYWAWMRGGGTNTHLLQRNRQSAQSILEGMQELGFVERAWNVVRNPREWLRALTAPLERASELSEYITRLAEFKKAREKARKAGMSELNAEEQGAYEARDLQDFALHGSDMRSMLALTAFQGAQIQGLDRGIRGFREDPKGFLLRASVLSAASIALAFLTHDDDRVKQLDDGQRDMFWCFAVGDDEEYTIYRFPKPFEIGVLFASLPERLTHVGIDLYRAKMKGEKGEDWAETPAEQIRSVLRSFWDVSLPNIVPTFSSPIIDNRTNVKTAFGTPIVPKRMEGLLPEYQYGPWTSPAMKELSHGVGELLGREYTFSPAKAENLINSYGGGWGRRLLSLVDWGMQKSGVVESPPEIARGIERLPIIHAITYSHPGANARDIRRFYAEWGRIDRGLKTLGYLRRNAAEGENEKELADLEREFEPYADVRKSATALGNILTAMRLVRSENRLSDKQRETLWNATVEAYGAPGTTNAEVDRLLNLSKNTNPKIPKKPKSKQFSQAPLSISLTPVERRDLLELLYKAALQVSREGIIRIRDCEKAMKVLEQEQKRAQAAGRNAGRAPAAVGE